ncbi:MAG TPA: hypothetical protein EYP08_02080 [Pyrodictiaceae archaeon]|nr:hypothetical protein [Pyrodictiaceae archaeon]
MQGKEREKLEGVVKLTGAGRKLAKLAVEKEALLELISHIYRAEAEGRITRADREEIVKRYAKEAPPLKLACIATTITALWLGDIVTLLYLS